MDEKEKILKFLQDIVPRDYQWHIFETASKKNTLVVLPTGLGKTLIALMLAIDRLCKFPESKVLFLAPTRPLAEQHYRYFSKHLPELFAQLEIFTGKVKAEKRKQLWQRADIVFSTPQCIANDLKNNLYDLQNVSLLIEDEAHRCLKNYAYTYVARKYKEQAKHMRVLGLTASPGHEKEKIHEIAENLGIEAIEVRTRQSPDVKQYLQKLEFQFVKLELPPELREIREYLKQQYEKKIEELQKRNLLFEKPTKKTLLELQHKIMRAIATGAKHYNLLAGATACAQAIKLQHAIELLETQTLYSLQNYMQDLFKQAAQGKSRAVKQLVKQQAFNKAYTRVVELIAKGSEHPKLFKLVEIIKQEFSAREKSKIIVFASYRDTVVRKQG